MSLILQAAKHFLLLGKLSKTVITVEIYVIKNTFTGQSHEIQFQLDLKLQFAVLSGLFVGDSSSANDNVSNRKSILVRNCDSLLLSLKNLLYSESQAVYIYSYEGRLQASPKEGTHKPKLYCRNSTAIE